MSANPETTTLTIEEIAEAAGVGRTAVSNWRARHKDFPTPDSSGRFSIDEVERWLTDKGKISGRIKRTASLWSVADALRATTLQATEILDLIIAGLIYLEAAERSAAEQPSPPVAWANLRELSDDTLLGELLEAGARLEASDPALEGLIVVGFRRAQDVPAASLRALMDALDTATTAETHRFELFEDAVRHVETLDRFHGEFATPDDLVELAVRIGGTDAQAILDPAVGQGALLLTAAIHPDRTEPPTRIHGFDVSRDIARRARARFYLYGLDADIRCEDALRARVDLLPKADLVVLDPPLNQADWGDNELYLDPKWAFGTPPRNDASLAWAQVALSALNAHGRAVVFTAPGPLFRHGRERSIREALLASGAVEAVIELPPRVRPETNMRLCVMVLRAPGSASEDSDVLFVDASGLGTAGRTTHRFEEEDLTRLVKAVEAFRRGEPFDQEIAWTADPNAIASNDYVLEPSRYRPLPDIDLSALIERYTALHDSLPSLTDAVQQHSAAVANPEATPAPTPVDTPSAAPAREPLKSVATITRGIRATPSENPDHPILFDGREVSQGSIAPLRHADPATLSRRAARVTTGDLVVRLSGHTIDSTMVTERHDGAILGLDCAVIRPNAPTVERAWLHLWLQSSDFTDQVARTTTATAAGRRLAITDLAELAVPVPPVTAQQQHAHALEALDRAVTAAKELHTALDELRKLEIDLRINRLPDQPKRRRPPRPKRR